MTRDEWNTLIYDLRTRPKGASRLGVLGVPSEGLDELASSK